MRIIIDNNILFSIMKPESMNSKLFSLINIEFIAPEFVIIEFNKYKDECLKKSGLSLKDFKKRKQEIFKNINFIENSKFNSLILDIKDSIPDPDDAPYIALGLFLNAPIWSNDKRLKNQDYILILSTKDLIDLIL